MDAGRTRTLVGKGALSGLAAVSGLAGVAGALVIAGVGVGPAGASQSTKAQLAQAKQALLVRSDFPSGWSTSGSVTTSNGGNSSFAGANQLASCLGVSASLINANGPSANSPTFTTKGGADTIENSITVFATTKLASQEGAAISSPKVPGCMNTVLQGPARQSLLGNVGQGVTIGTITTTAVPSSHLAGHATGFAMSFPVTSNGVTLQAQISIISMVRGKLGGQLTVETVGTPMSASLEKHLVTVASSRL